MIMIEVTHRSYTTSIIITTTIILITTTTPAQADINPIVDLKIMVTMRVITMITVVPAVKVKDAIHLLTDGLATEKMDIEDPVTIENQIRYFIQLLYCNGLDVYPSKV